MATGQPAPLTQGKTVTGDLVNAGNAVEDTAPRITAISPTGTLSDGTPTIRARVVDLQQMIQKEDVRLFVDGNRKRGFSYNTRSGTLSFTSGPMREGVHSVEITATDPRDARTSKNWTFRVN